MHIFPKLKTGAVMQYPAEKHVDCSTRVLRFLDGSEQRFRQFERSLRRWIIRLDRLSSDEWIDVQAFFVSMQGQAGTFSFTDPWTGVEYTHCSLDGDSMDITALSDESAKISLVIIEDLI